MRLIDSEPIIEMLKRVRKDADSPRRDLDLLNLQQILELAPEITQPLNDPLNLDELREMADEIADDFINYVTDGVQNAAPYCANMCSECCERPGWCTGYAKACKGFYPKAYRRKPEEETT